MRTFALLLALASLGHSQESFRSHAPTRPLPTAHKRPLAEGPSYFVDAAKGDDAGPGTEVAPWRTLAHGAAKLKPGDTLYLRGGTYYEHAMIQVQGTEARPITIRSYPGELAILDGGLREFYETPDKAWEPVEGGAPGEFRSTKTYPELAGSPEHSNVLGNFGDSMIPLMAYKFLGDLRSDNVYFNLKSNVGNEDHIYCGPGLWHDSKTHRIHVRLGHTKMKYLPDEDNYKGETDPRKLPLVVAGTKTPTLSIKKSRHLRIQDIVVRGSGGATVDVYQGVDIEFDGCTLYGGSTCIRVMECVGFRLIHTACRGLAAPWTFRGSLKYRAIESRLFSASGWAPSGQDQRDFELAYCEFTDSVDGVFVGSVKRLYFHHNLLDNVSDDGMFLTAATGYDGVTPGGEHYIYQNLFSRTLTVFAFGVGHGRQKGIVGGMQTGAGAYIYRNVFDFRRPVWYHQPRSPNEKQEVISTGRFASDHGGPTWEPMFIYHNTLIVDEVPRYTYASNGLGTAMGHGAKRRVFNNIVVQKEGLPGNFMPPTSTDFQADGNLLWSMGATKPGDDFFSKFRKSKAYEESKAKYAPGWGTNDVIADPRFTSFDRDWHKVVNLSLQEKSPAVDAGVTLPQEWPDPIRSRDAGKPDLGARPLNGAFWNVGVRGRLWMFGESEGGVSISVVENVPRRKIDYPEARTKPAPSVAIVEGYPAFDLPLLTFALRRNGAEVETLKHAWLEPKKYTDYKMVIVTGHLGRAKIEHAKFTADDLKLVEDYMKTGGTFVLTVSARESFATPEGKKFLAKITEGAGFVKTIKPQVVQNHAWVKHLDAGAFADVKNTPLHVRKSDVILGTPEGAAILAQSQVGKGRFIYIGWETHDALPYTRKTRPTPDEEARYEAQMQILLNLARP